MNPKENVSLASYSTMRLGGKARWLAEAESEEQLQRLVNWAKNRSTKFIVIGSGSNIVWKDKGFSGLVIVNQIPGKEVLQEDKAGAILKFGAGENWDKIVDWTVEKGLSGLEFLSLIPGKVGAAPVQNIGAYGAELSQVLKTVGVYDSEQDCFESILKESCGFSYRNSRFKSADKGRYLITHIVVELKKSNPAPPFYEALENYFAQHNTHQYTPAAVREAVIAIRSSKLPDPEKIANNGSFFTNPIVEKAKYDELKEKYPELKSWPADEGKVKLAAGWLVEKAGFRGVHDPETGMATWDKQALVLVNEHAHSTADLLKFKKKITSKVQSMFGVTLEQEPELLP